MKRELAPNEVLFNVDLNEGNGETDLKNTPQISSEYRKIKRAINIKQEGYNLYLIDSFSKEKVENLKKFIEKQYENLEPPKDICYVVIEDPKRPEALFLKSGMGKKLKETVEDIKNSYYDAAMEFYNTSSDSEKDNIIEDIHTKRSQYIGKLVDLSKKEGFDVKATTGGFAFIPLKEGEAMTEKEYDGLAEGSKDKIIEKANKLKKEAEVVLEKLKDLELSSIKKLKDIYTEYLDVELEVEKEDCLLNFIDEDEAYEYLERLFLNIEKGLVEAYSINVDDDDESINELLDKFQVSVLVDNTNNKHPRVIYEEDPSVMNLIGNIEYENHNGVYKSDMSLITSGSLLKANEGCIIIRLNQLIMNSYSYYYLKKALMTGKVSIDSSKNHLDILSINGLKPKAVPIKVKVIIIGNYENYNILYEGDEDFRKLFPLRVEMPTVVDRKDISVKSLKNFILERGKKLNLNNIDDEVIKEIIKYLSRIVNDRNKVNISSKHVDRILVLASNDLESRGKKDINKNDIINVAYEEELIEDQIMESYKSNKILLSLEGRKIGSINALAILNSGYYTFGKPMRVTCTACKGEGRIFDIQKESKLSGSIHEKSINILNGLLSNLISPYEKLPIDFNLSFEQTYGIIDGDSASVAEILCILSALSKKGIRQDIAVTGSINQFGEVQPIGGVNEKIEGFYKTCKIMNKNTGNAVLIPNLNKDNLILKPEVEKAIESKEFHIYTMDTLDDAIELMILNGNGTIEEFFKTINKEICKYKNRHN